MNELDQQSLRLIEKFDLLQSSFSFDPETFKYINLLKLEFYALENGAFLRPQQHKMVISKYRLSERF